MFSLVSRALVFTVLWVLLSKNGWQDWPLAVAVVAAATASSLALWPAGERVWRWRPLLGFAPFFLRESLVGGVDVARRAFSPRMPLQPELREIPLRLRGEGARVFFAWTVSLLPGTASVRLGEDRLRIHVLDARLPSGRKVRELEDRVAALFGERAGK
jgi:multicomponent Na+:H+ antiporter subunit E